MLKEAARPIPDTHKHTHKQKTNLHVEAAVQAQHGGEEVVRRGADHGARARAVPRPLVLPEGDVGARPARPDGVEFREEVGDVRLDELRGRVAKLRPRAVAALRPQAVHGEREALVGCFLGGC